MTVGDNCLGFVGASLGRKVSSKVQLHGAWTAARFEDTRFRRTLKADEVGKTLCIAVLQAGERCRAKAWISKADPCAKRPRTPDH